MATEKKADYMVDNGTDFDQIMFKTIAEQVRYSKDSSGNETSVKDKIDALNVNLGKKMDAIQQFSPKGIWCGSFTKSSYTGSTSVQLQNASGTLLTRTVLNNYFGVNYDANNAKAHYIAFVMNGDAGTCGIHISGATWNNDALYAVAEESLSGKTFRINWCVMLF